MTAVMRQQPGLAPNAPSGRQDVISALLDGYGNSFSGGDVSPYVLSPAPTLSKELPPPPPNAKPSGPMMKFQLRVDEPGSPLRYNGSQKDLPSPPTKIVSRSMSRNSKPASLRLLTSNGATAKLPSSPRPNVDLSSSPITPATANTTTRRSSEDRPLPSLPPPPPQKSERRNLTRDDGEAEIVGNLQSKGSNDDSQESRQRNPDVSKPLPAPAVKRKPLQTLADLSGPRGRKMGAKPPTAVLQNEAKGAANQGTLRPAPPAPSNPTQASEDVAPRNAMSGDRPRISPARAQVPASEEPAPRSLQPQRPFVGLPSRPSPRPRQSQENSEHTPITGQSRGSKGSNNGFDMFKGPPPPPSKNGADTNSNNTTTTINYKSDPRGDPSMVRTLTPSPTPPLEQSPPPASRQQAQSQQQVKRPYGRPESPVSPISPPNRRPFSFEPVANNAAPRVNPKPAPALTRPDSPISPPAEQIQPQAQPQPQAQSQAAPTSAFPPRITSKQSTLPAPPSLNPNPTPIPDRAALPSQLRNPASLDDEISQTTLPSQTIQLALAPSPTSPTSTYALTPLVPTSPTPTSLPLPSLLPSHKSCYHAHAHFNISSNRFAPMACMLCHTLSKQDAWACAWCYLRICATCKFDLERTPGRDLGLLLVRREGWGTEGR
ncbi:hypothetical protein BCR34DRAFT_389811 [Clohesyomyces aquaticus]|uniref:Uncharacterized protein n=1 Tax=Clohesyomyces aquaticus TaxID=1231657 RepID=A0A1Y1ZER8_9PLEO|nr:hypothetical protein BCR34DRAFT_389811 [Clohesyomyces aquaticus]